ncbi:MAG: response regulator [Mariprofundus sp.]|nr:response regulator [Mariprofundus sp.]
MANILVTDDSLFLRRILCKILADAGHQMTGAANGVECLQHIEQDTPDIVFLDLVMPEMDGFGVLQALKEQHATVPVIVLTADIQETVRVECLALGAVAFINKPLKEDQVLEILNAALDALGVA